jgi:predicted Zn-dependent peptidase
LINFHRKVLQNGLIVLIHEDRSTPLVAVNLLYKVGSRNEHPEKTGFAHLFEHLMFSGSENAASFDEPIQFAGGESNAFTNNDTTNFYEILPSENLETCLWLESDRMKSLLCNELALDIQKKVVVEEFKETTLNQPYGDVWHTITAEAFKDHPYQWPTIGKIPEHVSEANLSEVQNFYKKYYNPNNAIITIAGNITSEKGFYLVEKWFGDIHAGVEFLDEWPTEKKQIKLRKIEKTANVPLRSMYLSFHMSDRLSPDFYVCDVISDLLSGGRSSRFYQRLMKEKEMISYADAYVTGTLDPGLFIIEAKPSTDYTIDQVKEVIWKELDDLKKGNIGQKELTKIKNKIESALIYSEINVLNKAINLSYYEMIGDASLINKQTAFYRKVTVEDIAEVAQKIFKETNCTEVIYNPENENTQ